MLENVRLQHKRRAQERREQELVIHASQSELKALRAQINPHFLFNALNAIAGLIHKNPHRAEDTVEQLSEVFRYTLTGSEKEWSKLEYEMDFVRSYLEVEQARFGERLQTSIEIEESTRNLEIPAMTIQTLVENAAKHGVARVRGTGRIKVRACRIRDRLRIHVEDNGPGFQDGGRQPRGTGHGLKNVRERLQGLFGDEARLDIGRDESRDLTVVVIEIPAHRPEKANEAGQP
jgi:LytS/YehU family sensor histidine kinase